MGIASGLTKSAEHPIPARVERLAAPCPRSMVQEAPAFVGTDVAMSIDTR